MRYLVEIKNKIESDHEKFSNFESKYFIRTVDYNGQTWVFDVDEEIETTHGQAINDFLDSQPCIKSYRYEV